MCFDFLHVTLEAEDRGSASVEITLIWQKPRKQTKSFWKYFGEEM